jgi:hypothetical protein
MRARSGQAALGLSLLMGLAAPASVDAQCSYSLSTRVMTVPGEGGTGGVTVTTAAGCAWAASSDRTWLTVLTPGGVGSGTVTWQAVPNTLPYSRIGYLTIAGISIFTSQPPAPPGTPAPPPAPTPPPAVPGAPSQLAAAVSGNSVALTWNAPASGVAPATYVLAAGSAPGWSNLGSIPTGTLTSFNISNVPNGTYFARVSAQNGAGTSAASNEVTFTVPQACGGVPEPPSGLQSSVSGLLVTLSWSAPAHGVTPAAYVIEAGSAPGLANIAVVNTASVATTFSASAVPGSYFVRVRAASLCGNSSPSPDVGIVVR